MEQPENNQDSSGNVDGKNRAKTDFNFRKLMTIRAFLDDSITIRILVCMHASETMLFLVVATSRNH